MASLVLLLCCNYAGTTVFIKVLSKWTLTYTVSVWWQFSTSNFSPDLLFSLFKGYWDSFAFPWFSFFFNSKDMNIAPEMPCKLYIPKYSLKSYFRWVKGLIHYIIHSFSVLLLSCHGQITKTNGWKVQTWRCLKLTNPL